MLLWSRTVLGQPVPQARHRVGRGSARRGRPRGFHDPRSEAHREALVCGFTTASGRGGVGRAHPRIDEPVRVEIFVAGARLDSDGDNHAKQILDALVQAEVLVADDLRVVRRHSVEAIEGDPRTVVEIYRRHGHSPAEVFAASLSVAQEVFGVTDRQILSSQRTSPVWEARAACVRRMRIAGFSLPDIGTALGRRHSTPRSILARLEKRLSREPELVARCEQLDVRVDDMLAQRSPS